MKTVSTVFVSFLLAVAACSGLDVRTVLADTIHVPACITHSANLRIGATDASSAGEVTSVQNFLADQGFFDRTLLGGGRFGPVTYRAVIAFQKAHNVSATGYVGPLTRAAMNAISCPTPIQTPISLYFVSPTSTPVGTKVSITGFGFTSSNTVLMDGLIATRNVPITSSIAVACTTDPSCRGGIRQTIEFVVPTTLTPNCPVGSYCPLFLRQVVPSTYTVTVQNDQGTSTSLKLEVTSGS